MPKHKLSAEAPVESKIEKKKEKDLGKLGSIYRAVRIVQMSKKMVNGRLLNDVHCEDGTTYLLADEDLNSQWIKPEEKDDES